MENMETLLAAVAQTRGFDDDEPVASTAPELGLRSSDPKPVIRGDINGLQLNGEGSGDVRPAAVVDTPPPAPASAISAVGLVTGAEQRRKRGRPPKGQNAAKPPPPKRQKPDDEEEDVCFICFDGGCLVLCDRKGCPKAYHPACIKRDEAFFRSKAKWNCGWHICSVCRKASYYMCYTCTYSLCKGCTKDADYLRVRGNKGFCSTCLKTIMLIENKDQPNESVQVDFDDQGSWEYLFKVYWVCLKQKLSLTLSELSQAQQPRKGVPIVACKLQLNDVHHAAVDGKVSNSHRCTEHLELNKPHVETSLQQNDGLRAAVSSIDDYVERIDCKNGGDGPSRDKDAIKPNVDSLTNEPGTQEATDKPGIEKDPDKPGVVKGTDNPCICKSTNNKELDKPGIERASQNNLNEYAAIDVHNINLIYLRRNLMANLLEEGQDDFNNKVIGSIVRIRTSSNDQKQDACRLVQVVGTSMVAEPYKIGERTANVMLEVLNLGKKEVVSIDAISNQEFTEDECGQLRQSIRCGIVKQFTVAELQIKAMALQPVRINNWLEAEMLRLNNLRDQASENGRKKELREYVDKLQLLKSPEEHQRRIAEVPEIHDDPKMSPNYESEEDNGSRPENSKKGDYVKRSLSGFSQNGRKPIAHNKKGKEEQPIQSQNRRTEEADASGSHSSDKHMNKVHVSDSAVGNIDDQATPRSGLQTSAATSSVGKSPSANNIETQKLWHYRDPNGKIQGPFSMVKLRTWSTTGLFPPDMRIWTNHEQYDSLLLTDALIGHLHGELDLSHKPSPGPRENEAIEGIGVGKDSNGTSRYSKQTEVACSNNVSVLSDNNTGFVRENETDSRPQCWGLLKDNDSSAGGVRASDVLPLPSNGQTDVALPAQGQENDDFNHGPRNGEKNLNGLTQNRMTSGDEHKNKCNDEDGASQSSEENLRSLNTGLSLNHMESGSVVAPVSKSPDLSKQVGKIDGSDLPSPTPRTAESQQSVSGILELFSPTPRANNEDQGGHTTETKQSGISNFPVPDSGPTWSRASGPVGGVQLSDVADEWCRYSPVPVKTPVQEWDSGLVSSSSLKNEVTDEYAGTPSSDHTPPSHPASNMPNWLAILNEPIVFDALGEDSVSDLLAEADAVESQRTLPSPTSAMKFVRELFEDCNDDCFSSIENFSPTPEPRRSNMLSSSGETQFSSQSLPAFKHTETFDAHDSLKKSSVNSSASSEGGTIAPVHSGDAVSEFRPPAPNNTSQDVVGAPITTGSRSDAVDPGCGTVQGNINLVTVQGNVNLVLGGPAQGMANLGWGTNPGTTWVNPNINRSPINGSLPWDGQRKYGGERFTSPRERSYQGSDSGFGRGRPPRGRQPYGGGGYSRPLPKGQRVCKFYGSGRCKKGAFCDYLHP